MNMLGITIVYPTMIAAFSMFSCGTYADTIQLVCRYHRVQPKPVGREEIEEVDADTTRQEITRISPGVRLIEKNEEFDTTISHEKKIVNITPRIISVERRSYYRIYIGNEVFSIDRSTGYISISDNTTVLIPNEYKGPKEGTQYIGVCDKRDGPNKF